MSQFFDTFVQFFEDRTQKIKGAFYCGIILNKICQLSVVLKNREKRNAGYILRSL